MTDFFKPDPRITDPAMRDLEKKVHWLMYMLYQSNTADMLDSIGIDNAHIDIPSFPPNCDISQIAADANDVGNNSDE